MWTVIGEIFCLLFMVVTMLVVFTGPVSVSPDEMQPPPEPDDSCLFGEQQ